MIRVLVAEDSTTARQLLVAVLSADPDVAVIGEATNGVEAIEMTRRLRPDVITMDVQMPRLDGFEATKQIMIETPTAIVIVSASIDPRDVAATMHALRAGALAIIPGPVIPGHPDFGVFATQLLTAVKACSQVKVVRQWPRRSPSRATPRGTRPRVVALAASTGGPAAVHRILAELPGDFALPILLVQHIARGFVGGFAEWLNASSALHVGVAREGVTLARGNVYIAPEDRHLGITGRLAAATPASPPIGGFRPAATYLFESVAAACGAATLAVLLTGMGADGVAGLGAVQRAGGRIIIQDEESSVVFGMPGAAIAAGLGELVLPLGSIAAKLVELAGEG